MMLGTVGDLGDGEDAVRVCHTSAEAAQQVVALCDSIGWEDCEAAGVENYGDDTGCREDAPTLRETLEV